MSCPVRSTKDDDGGEGGCPVNRNGLNPLTMMPPADQRPRHGQTIPLSTRRKDSTIPMGSYVPKHQTEDQETWAYPSEQQYFNAMSRKGWNPQEQDMPYILAIHNAVNEKGWSEVLKWERTCHGTEKPLLTRFEGRPKDVTPKAFLRSLIGYALPFDRHDWIVDRNGEEVRYVIDFYSGHEGIGVPDPLRSKDAVSMYLDIRPAVDSVGSALDRLYMGALKSFFPEKITSEYTPAAGSNILAGFISAFKQQASNLTAASAPSSSSNESINSNSTDSMSASSAKES